MHSLDQGTFEDIFTWSFNGLSFIIIDPKAFTEKVLPSHFKTAKFESFKRKLKRWGFAMRRGAGRHGVVDPSTLWVCHPYFQRGNSELCKKISVSKSVAVFNNTSSTIVPCNASTTSGASSWPPPSSCFSSPRTTSVATDSSTNASSLPMLTFGDVRNSPTNRSATNCPLSVALANDVTVTNDDGRSASYSSWPLLLVKDGFPPRTYDQQWRQRHYYYWCFYGPIHDRSAPPPAAPVSLVRRSQKEFSSSILKW
jgi:hypothetical protein